MNVKVLARCFSAMICVPLFSLIVLGALAHSAECQSSNSSTAVSLIKIKELNAQLRAQAAVYSSSTSYWQFIIYRSLSEVPGGSYDLSNGAGIYYAEDPQGRARVYLPNPIAREGLPVELDHFRNVADNWRRGVSNKFYLMWCDVSGRSAGLGLNTRKLVVASQVIYDKFPTIAKLFDYPIPAGAEPLFSDSQYSSFGQFHGYLVGYIEWDGSYQKRRYFSDGSALKIGRDGIIRKQLNQYQHWREDINSRKRFTSSGRLGRRLPLLVQRASAYLHTKLGIPVGTIAKVDVSAEGEKELFATPTRYRGDILIAGYVTADQELVRFSQPTSVSYSLLMGNKLNW